MEPLLIFLGGLQFWHWLALGLALALVQIVTGWAALAGPALAAWATGLAAMWFVTGWQVEFGLFAGLGVLFALVSRVVLPRIGPPRPPQ